MKKISSALLKCFAAVLLFTACKKNQSNEDYTETEVPVIPVFTEKVTATVSGFITDEGNKPVINAIVTAGAITVNTDEYGYFEIPGASLTKNIGLIKVSRPGYFTGFKTIAAKANEASFFRLMLMSKKESGSFTAGTGGTVQSTDAVSIVFPANSIVDAATGSAYTGVVHVSAKLLPATATDEKAYTLPGDARGLNSDGHLRSLNAHAAIAVDLNGDAGQKLQLATNSKATVTMPIATSLQAKAPASIALWSFDEEKGVYREEGTLTKNGNNYTGQVSHFSFWSGATSVPLVNFRAQVLNSGLQPLANVPVVISLAGVPVNAGYGKFAFTDANGFVSGGIPANRNFVLNVMTTCSVDAYNHYFSTTSSDIDLGAITGNLGQAVVTLSGTVNKCNGQPVTNGYVQTYDHGFYNRIPVVNGSFSFTGLLCNNQPVNYVAVDEDNYQQNTPQTITLAAGNNNLGVLSACGISTVGVVTYTLNGNTRTVAEPAAVLSAFYDEASGTTSIARIPPVSGGSDLSFQFNGGKALGSNHKVSDIWSIGYPSGRAFASTPLTVTITEYGEIGGFISGSFSGTVLDFVDNSQYTVNYNFRVKRKN